MRYASHSARKTQCLGRLIARRLKKGDIICLCGPFGAGKTVLVKGIAAGLGIPVRKVISPSFVLIREYPKAKIPLYHFDLYRMKSECEISDLGYEEYFYDAAVTVVEWAEKLKSLLPKEYLKIEVAILGKNKRRLKFTGYGRRYKELLGMIYPALQSGRKIIGGRAGCGY